MTWKTIDYPTSITTTTNSSNLSGFLVGMYLWNTVETMTMLSALEQQTCIGIYTHRVSICLLSWKQERLSTEIRCWYISDQAIQQNMESLAGILKTVQYWAFCDDDILFRHSGVIHDWHCLDDSQLSWVRWSLFYLRQDLDLRRMAEKPEGQMCHLAPCYLLWLIPRR